MDIDAKGIAFPLRLGPGRNLALVDGVDDVRAMLEQILLTSPGERVNRPTFGVGVLAYVFEPNSPLIASRIRAALDENVYNYLGKNVKILGVTVEQEEAELLVTVSFRLAGSIEGDQSLTVSVPIGGQP